MLKIIAQIDPTNSEHLKAAQNFMQALGAQPAAQPASKPTEQTQPEPRQESTEQAPPEPAKKAEPSIDIDEVRAAVAQKAKTHRQEIKDKLAELGAKNVSSLDASKYKEMLDFVNGL